MRAKLRVLSEDQRAKVHERTLSVLSRTGVRVDTARGRAILEGAGADVDRSTCIVRFPRTLVEESLRLAPKDFALGGRRSGWDQQILASHQVLPLDEDVERELDRIQKRAQIEA